jgi:hypothetical protein
MGTIRHILYNYSLPSPTGRPVKYITGEGRELSEYLARQCVRRNPLQFYVGIETAGKNQHPAKREQQR